MRLIHLAVLAIGFLILGCPILLGDEPLWGDDVAGQDAGLRQDVGWLGTGSDAAAGTDSGLSPDAGNAADGGAATDTGLTADAGPQGPVECFLRPGARGDHRQASCPEGSICVKNDGVCNGQFNGVPPVDLMLPGTCQPLVAECPEAAEGDAVCGCRGATYASRCHAQLHDVDVAESGVCRDQSALNRCTTAADCGRDESYCATPLGHCNAVAFCLPNPNMCTEAESELWGVPVCDCNGREHDNLCNARLAGQSVRDFSVGPCR